MGRRTSLESPGGPNGGKGTAIGHVRGLGSARSGTGHYMQQRFTAVGNLLLIGFLAVSFVLLPNFDYATVLGWLSQPIPALAVGLIMINTFWHARLGLQVLIEDYVHVPGNKFAALLALNIAAFGGMAFGLLSVARIALGAST